MVSVTDRPDLDQYWNMSRELYWNEMMIMMSMMKSMRVIIMLFHLWSYLSHMIYGIVDHVVDDHHKHSDSHEDKEGFDFVTAPIGDEQAHVHCCG